MTDPYEAAAREIHYAKDCHRDWFNGVKNCDCWDAAKAGVDAFLAASPDLYRKCDGTNPECRNGDTHLSHDVRVGEEPE